MLKIGESYERNNFVFATDEGKPFYLRNLRKRNFQVILEKANLKGFRLYDLRHSLATLLLSEGIILKSFLKGSDMQASSQRLILILKCCRQCNSTQPQN